MKTMNTRSMILTACMLITCLIPAIAAKTLPMQSTAPMQSIGSGYAAQVREAYAPDVKYHIIPMHSTSTMMITGEVATPFSDSDEEETMARRGPRRGFDTGAETGKSEEYPVGEPWVMLLFAAFAAGAIALRARSAKSADGCRSAT